MPDLPTIRRFVVCFWSTALVLLPVLYRLHCGIKPGTWASWITGVIVGIGLTIVAGLSKWRRNG